MDEPFSSSLDSFSEVLTLNSTVVLPTTLRSSLRQTVSAEIVASMGLFVVGVAVIANALVLVVLVRARRQFGSCVHTLIVNQCVMDLYTSISAVPVYVMMLTRGFEHNRNQILDGAICVIVDGGALTALGLSAEKIGLVVITLERYFKIVHAIPHRRYYRNWMTKVGVAFPWVSAACLSLFPALSTTRIVNGRCLRLGVWPNKTMALVRLIFFCVYADLCNNLLLNNYFHYFYYHGLSIK